MCAQRSGHPGRAALPFTVPAKSKSAFMGRVSTSHVRPKSVPVQSDRVSVGRLCKVLSLRLEAPAGGAVETAGAREEADLLDNQLGSSRNRTLHEIGPQGFLPKGISSIVEHSCNQCYGVWTIYLLRATVNKDTTLFAKKLLHHTLQNEV